ncbi:pteridine reductase [Luteimonas granuli]|uniref:Pteridine reductase n=1 Tax=Luteimonas granuli TaxID=1176533 RepID=A0A518N3S4_9GAMM|nr:pteridine reductase [Luteimonas granuli]QDW66570.1 pteridine reductase [Luteimonas granuli]
MQGGHPVALVTGAARRLGAAIARRLHAEGYDLSLHHRGSAGEAAALATELEAARAGSVLSLQAELGEFDRLPELVARTVGRFGRLDALVNNASAFAPATFGDIHPGHWDTMMAVNAKAPFFLAQAAAPHLRAARGAIVNLSDVYARAPRSDLAAYATSKGALEAATRALAVALAPEVRVNAVAPGAILWPEEGIDPALRERLLAMTPLGRTGTPEEIAGAVLWLLRDARYTTGSVLAVDGGRHLG